MRFYISEKNIKEARQGSNNCPIALSIKDVLGESFTIVGAKILTIFGPMFKNRVTKYTIPDIAQQFIKDYDRGRLVKPFFFELPIGD